MDYVRKSIEKDLEEVMNKIEAEEYDPETFLNAYGFTAYRKCILWYNENKNDLAEGLMKEFVDEASDVCADEECCKDCNPEECFLTWVKESN